MAAVVTQVYGVARNFQRQTLQEVQVAAIPYDSGELAFLGLTATGDSTATVGNRVERTLQFTEIGTEFSEKFPTQSLMEAAVASLFQLVFELQSVTPERVTVQTVVVP